MPELVRENGVVSDARRPIEILLVEDNAGDALIIRRLLAETDSFPSRCRHVTSLREAGDPLQDGDIDVVLLDLSLPDADGLATVKQARALAPKLPIVVLTGREDENMAVAAVREGAQDYLNKNDVDARLLWRSIRYATERQQAEQMRRRLQDALTRAKTMEALGTLASGVAHDFNNLLTAILANITLAIEEADPRELRDILQDAEKSCIRAAELVKRLLAVGRKTGGATTLVDVNETVDDVCTILRETLPRRIDLSVRLGRDLPRVYANPAEIHGVLLNLCINARDAVIESAERRGGSYTPTIRIVTEMTSVAAGSGPEGSPARPGPHVVLAVEDNGCGMTDEVRERMFDPFYTTKGPRDGAGLGLATAYATIEHLGGFIGVTTVLDEGTTFRVHLPAAAAPPPHEVDPDVTEDAAVVGGNETLLFVDDEESIVAAATRQLRDLGYRVEVARDGLAALEIMRADPGRIDLVVMDAAMPSLSGPDALREMLASNPSLRCLMTSGTPAVRDEVAGMVVGFLGKPYRLHDLIRSIRSILDEGKTPGRSRSA